MKVTPNKNKIEKVVETIGYLLLICSMIFGFLFITLLSLMTYIQIVDLLPYLGLS